MQALSLCPSFNAYSSAALADIAARVVDEFRNEPHPNTLNDLFHWPNPNPPPAHLSGDEEENGGEVANGDGDDDDFEFAFVSTDPGLSPISADEIFYNGQIKPVYPVFNRDLLLGAAAIDRPVGSNSKPPSTTPSRRMPLRKLMIEDRETTTSCSSSEADDLDSVPPETYCVWAPKQPGGGGDSGRKCKKSCSTGSSRRWKLRDLIHRSNSDGKDTYVFLSPAGKKESSGEAGKGEGGGERLSVKELGEKKRSYKQDLMGILANVNGLSRNLHPF